MCISVLFQTPFLVSNSYLHPFGACCPCPTAWDCKEAKFNMASGRPTPRVPRWATHSFGVEVLLGNGKVHETIKMNAWQKQSCKTRRFLSCREKLEQTWRWFHVQKFGCKWKCLGTWKEETKLMTRTSHMSQCSSLCVHLS